jgi:hypothetical protein
MDFQQRKDEVANFHLVIEELVETKNVSYVDAICLYCEQTGLEVEVAAKLVSNTLKSKIRVEAEALNLVEKNKSKKIVI